MLNRYSHILKYYRRLLLQFIFFKKEDIKFIFAYIKVLLQLFRNVDWFSLCANFVSSCHVVELANDNL